jgi:hypothetical protein
MWLTTISVWRALHAVSEPPLVPPAAAGHWHYSYRQLPYNAVTGAVDKASVSADNHTYTDPKYVTMIVSGAPGDVERNDGCPGDASIAPLLVTCSSGYGYGIFTVHNSTALYWEFTAQQTPIGATGTAGGKGRRWAGAAPVTYRDYLWIRRSAPPA